RRRARRRRAGCRRRPRQRARRASRAECASVSWLLIRASAQADILYIGSSSAMPLPAAKARIPQPARLTYWDLLAGGLAVLLAVIVYLNALHNPFVYDDRRLILGNASIE